MVARSIHHKRCCSPGSAQPASLNRSAFPIIVDLPGVGDNLQDHALLTMEYAAAQRTRTVNSLFGPDYQEYLRSGGGQLAVNRTAGGAFVKSRPDVDIPDMQLYTVVREDDDENDDDFGIVLSILRP